MISAIKTKLSIAVIALVMIIAAGWSLLAWSDASDDADRAASDLQATHSLVREIISLQPASLKANTQGDPSTRLPKLIDDAMKSAEIEAEILDRISPQPARTIGQSSVSEIPMQLVFREISLHQLLTFVISLVHGNDWLCVRNVHLLHPQGIAGQGSNAQWNVEIILSYLTDQQKASGSTAALAN